MANSSASVTYLGGIQYAELDLANQSGRPVGPKQAAETGIVYANIMSQQPEQITESFPMQETGNLAAKDVEQEPKKNCCKTWGCKIALACTFIAFLLLLALLALVIFGDNIFSKEVDSNNDIIGDADIVIENSDMIRDW